MKTQEQENANRFDCDLYRLILAAHTKGDKDFRWRKIAMLLQAARGPVRTLMHPSDREKTQ